jgi:hypothetical protein
MRKLKVQLAQQLVRTLDGTAHAVDAVLAAEILSSAVDDSNPTSDVSNEVLFDLFKPYKHAFVCRLSGWCTDYGNPMKSFDDLASHFDSRDHDLGEFDDSKTWVLPGWAEVVTSAFVLLGNNAAEDQENADELEAEGRRWLCQDCPEFEVAVEKEKRCDKSYKRTPTTALGWDRMVRFPSSSEAPPY